MPTGYTADIHSGKDDSLKGFMLRSLSNFSMFLRDEKINDYFDVDSIESSCISYYEKELDKLKELKNKLEKKPHEDLVKQWRQEQEESFKEFIKSQESQIKAKKTYEDMIEKLNKWECSDNLNHYKEFLIQQLEASMNYDYSPYDNSVKSFDTWLN